MTTLTTETQGSGSIPSASTHTSSSTGSDISLSTPNQGPLGQDDSFFGFGDINFDFLNAFTLLGDEELGFEQGGLMENLIQLQGEDDRKI